jgi:hypothetical protein
VIGTHQKRQVQAGPQSQDRVERGEADACSNCTVDIGIELSINHVGKQKMLAEPLRFAVPKVFKEGLGYVTMQVFRGIGAVRKMRKPELFRESLKNIFNFTFIGIQVGFSLQARKNQKGSLNGNNRSVRAVSQGTPP